MSAMTRENLAGALAVVVVAVVAAVCSPTASAVPIDSCGLQTDTAAKRHELSALDGLFGQLLSTESNGDVYYVSICHHVPQMSYDPRKLVGAVKHSKEGYSIDLGLIDQSNVIVNDSCIVLIYMGDDGNRNPNDTCKGLKWSTYLTIICDPLSTMDILTLIEEDPDQPDVCKIRFEIKTSKTCIRQPIAVQNIHQANQIDSVTERTKSNEIIFGNELSEKDKYNNTFRTSKNAFKNKLPERNEKIQRSSNQNTLEHTPLNDEKNNISSHKRSSNVEPDNKYMNVNFEHTSPSNANYYIRKRNKSMIFEKNNLNQYNSLNKNSEGKLTSDKIKDVDENITKTNSNINQNLNHTLSDSILSNNKTNSLNDIKFVDKETKENNSNQTSTQKNNVKDTTTQNYDEHFSEPINTTNIVNNKSNNSLQNNSQTDTSENKSKLSDREDPGKIPNQNTNNTNGIDISNEKMYNSKSDSNKNGSIIISVTTKPSEVKLSSTTSNDQTDEEKNLAPEKTVDRSINNNNNNKSDINSIYSNKINTQSTQSTKSPVIVTHLSKDNRYENLATPVASQSEDNPNSGTLFSKLFPNGIKLSATTIIGVLGSLSAVSLLIGGAINRYYYKQTGTDQIPLKRTFQSIYEYIKKFLSKICCCCGGNLGILDFTNEKTPLLQPKMFTTTTVQDETLKQKAKTSSDDNMTRKSEDFDSDNSNGENNTKTYGSMANSSKSNLDSQSTSYNDGKSSIVDEVWKKFEKTDEEKMKKNIKEQNEDNTIQNGVNVKSSTDFDNTLNKNEVERPSHDVIIEEISAHSLLNEPQQNNVKSIPKIETIDNNTHSEMSKLNDLIANLQEFGNSNTGETNINKNQSNIIKPSIIQAEQTESVYNSPNNTNGRVSNKNEKVELTSESNVSEKKKTDDDDESIEVTEEIIYVDGVNGEKDGEFIIEETTETTTTTPDANSGILPFSDSHKGPTTTTVRKTTTRKISSSSGPDEITNVEDTIVSYTPEHEKSKFGFGIGIGKSGLNVSVGNKNIGIDKSGVNFGEYSEQNDAVSNQELTLKLNESGLKFNRNKNKTSKNIEESIIPVQEPSVELAFDEKDIQPSEKSKKSKTLPNLKIFKRSVSQPKTSDIEEVNDESPLDVVSKKKGQSTSLFRLGKSKPKSPNSKSPDKTDVNVNFLSQEQHASTVSTELENDGNEIVGERKISIKTKASKKNSAKKEKEQKYFSVPKM